MSLYHMINGVNPCTFFFLPMLGKHPDEYPRFRDCFLRDEDHPQYANKLHVYTRVGGGNREHYQDEIRMLRQMPGYVTDYDDSFDSTYATFVFDIPPQWADDFQRMQDGIHAASNAYVDECCRVYPKIADKLRAAFRPEKEQTA